MAKFCGKCGTKLDEKTGLCPKCDGEKLEDQKRIAAKVYNNSISLSKKEQKIQKKAIKNAKYGKGTVKQKIKKILKKSFLIALLLCVLTGTTIVLLEYSDVVSVNQIMQVLGVKNPEEYSSNGSLITLQKDFTKRSITDEASAVLAAQEVAKKLGYKNAFDELKLYVSSSIGNECFYKLQQYYKEIPVYGRYVTVVATEDGDALNMISDAIDIDNDISMNTQVSNDQVQTLIKEYAKNNWGVLYDDISIPELSDDLRVIYNQDGKSRLAYKLIVINGEEYTVIVDANTGEILDEICNINDVSSVGMNADGTKEVPVEYNESDNTYTMHDVDRSIYLYNINKRSSRSGTKYWDKRKEVISVGDNIFGNTKDEIKQSPEIAINVLNSVGAIADYYKTTFNQEVPFGGVIVCYNDGYYWGKNALGGEQSFERKDGTKITYGFLSVGYSLKGDEQDILAHEYTHIIEHVYNASMGNKVVSQAIAEGLADTFSCFFNKEPIVAPNK